jgi:hypothetical protein
MKKKSNESYAASDNGLEIAPTPPEFFKSATMGRHYKEYSQGASLVRLVTLEEDVAAVFKDSKSVNGVLRAIIKNLPQTNVKKRKKSA